MRQWITVVVCLLLLLAWSGPALATSICGPNQEYRMGSCVCKPGFQMIGGNCVEACQGGMVMINGKCQCPSGMYWDESARKCLSQFPPPPKDISSPEGVTR